MKKRITVVLEVESEDDHMMDNEFIKDDLESEINCCSNYYDIVSFESEELS